MLLRLFFSGLIWIECAPPSSRPTLAVSGFWNPSWPPPYAPAGSNRMAPLKWWCRYVTAAHTLSLSVPCVAAGGMSSVASVPVAAQPTRTWAHTRRLRAESFSNSTRLTPAPPVFVAKRASVRLRRGPGPAGGTTRVGTEDSTAEAPRDRLYVINAYEVTQGTAVYLVQEPPPTLRQKPTLPKLLSFSFAST